jgi:hypothetical protein
MLVFSGVDVAHLLLPLGAAAFAVYYTVSSITSWLRLRHVPGPFLASFSCLWLMRNNFLGISSTQLLSLKKYGSVVRVAPNYVLTDDPVALRRISGARSKYSRDIWWTGVRMDPRKDNMLTTMDTAEHDWLKSKTANGYNGHDGVDIEGGIDTQIAKLKDMIRLHYLSTPTQTRKADLVWIIRYFTMDSVTSLAYGEPFGYLEANEDLYGFNKQVQDMAKPMAVMLDTPILRTLVNSPLAPHLLPKVTDKKGMGRLIRQALALSLVPSMKSNSNSLCIKSGPGVCQEPLHDRLYRLERYGCTSMSQHTNPSPNKLNLTYLGLVHAPRVITGTMRS